MRSLSEAEKYAIGMAMANIKAMTASFDALDLSPLGEIFAKWQIVFPYEFYDVLIAHLAPTDLTELRTFPGELWQAGLFYILRAADADLSCMDMFASDLRLEYTIRDDESLVTAEDVMAYLRRLHSATRGSVLQ